MDGLPWYSVLAIVVSFHPTSQYPVYKYHRLSLPTKGPALQHWYCTNGNTTTLPATSEIDCTGCPFSSAWSTRSVCWFLSVFTRRHQSTLQWWVTRFLPLLAEVIADLQHAAIWRYLYHERLTDKEVFPSLVRHCGTHCHSLFAIHLWQWRNSAHIWRLFCFAEHIVLSIAPSWQFRL